jgi:hypothetical protein
MTPQCANLRTCYAGGQTALWKETPIQIRAAHEKSRAKDFAERTKSHAPDGRGYCQSYGSLPVGRTFC